MSRTVIPFGSRMAQKKWSPALFLDIKSKSYFDKKFIGESDAYCIQRLTDLESEAGDEITFDLSIELRNRPTYGDNALEGKEESLRFASDSIKIDQMRHGVNAGGKMSRKRIAHDLRMIGKQRLSDYWARFNDEMLFIYLSGSRGVNKDFVETVEWTGHAGNPIQAPDDQHLLRAGDATSDATLDANDIMTRKLIETAKTKAEMMAAEDPENAAMCPLNINGESHYVMIMSQYQEHDLRTNDQGGWLEIQKAAAAAEGRNNPIFKGGLGMVGNVVLHSHRKVIRRLGGSSGTLETARALLLGRQAGVIANGGTGGKGGKGGIRYSWSETTIDHGNQPVVAAGTICGVKKTRFNGRDYGVIAVDTAAVAPA